MNKAPILLGSTVISKAGRDEGRTFLVVKSLDDEYVLISDGDTHRMEKPKKKKRRHLKLVCEPTSEVISRLSNGQPVLDFEVRRWLSREEG